MYCSRFKMACGYGIVCVVVGFFNGVWMMDRPDDGRETLTTKPNQRFGLNQELNAQLEQRAYPTTVVDQTPEPMEQMQDRLESDLRYEGRPRHLRKMPQL